MHKLLAPEDEEYGQTHNVMGTMKSHFFAGVYWAPSSICSHSVRLSYTPP